MRLCRFIDGATARIGSVEDSEVVPLDAPDLLAALLAGSPPPPAGPARPLASVELLAPLRPGTLLGIGLNYRDHAAETGAALPAEPLIFAKLAGAITAPRGEIVRPAYTAELDYEGELAVVIGRASRDVPVEAALGHVAGYAVMNDVSARDRQRAEPQWVRAKGGDTFAPFGPWITSAAEVPDPQDLRIRTWVDGELRQDGHTGDMVFGVADLVAYCSRQFTLEAGDVITTGTPAGVGAGRNPPAYLDPGATVRVEIEGLGGLEHVVVEG